MILAKETFQVYPDFQQVHEVLLNFTLFTNGFARRALEPQAALLRNSPLKTVRSLRKYEKVRENLDNESTNTIF